MSQVTDEDWAEFKEKFDKTYKDSKEENMRREQYAKSKVKIDEHNRKYKTGEVVWKMGINHLADLTEEEFNLRCGTKI